MQLRYLTTLLTLAGAALARPIRTRHAQTLEEQDAKSIVEAIMPKSVSCDGRGAECRTAEVAAPLLAAAMTKYKITTPTEQAGILALIAYESLEMQYSKNLKNAAAGQGTSNMQMGNFNIDYANSIDELRSLNLTPATVLDKVTADEYNFGTGPWFYKTQCSSAQSAASGDADAWFQAYMSCVGVDPSAQPERLTYWENAKEAFGTC